MSWVLVNSVGWYWRGPGEDAAHWTSEFTKAKRFRTVKEAREVKEDHLLQCRIESDGPDV